MIANEALSRKLCKMDSEERQTLLTSMPQVEIPDEKDERFCVLSFEQVKRLNDLMCDVVDIHGRVLGEGGRVDEHDGQAPVVDLRREDALEDPGPEVRVLPHVVEVGGGHQGQRHRHHPPFALSLPRCQRSQFGG